METITVRIQGESDWLHFTFNVEELNKLKNPALFLPPISAKIGKLLDIGLAAVLSVENKKEVETLLSQYVANLNTYQMMLTNGMHSLFITSFRAKGPRVGYMTRVAGAVRDHISNCMMVNINNPSNPTPEDVGYTILLKLIYTNQAYKKDKYHSNSVFRLITRESVMQFAEKIEIRETQNVQSN